MTIGILTLLAVLVVAALFVKKHRDSKDSAKPSAGRSGPLAGGRSTNKRPH